jgi:hypothetical protein
LAPAGFRNGGIFVCTSAGVWDGTVSDETADVVDVVYVNM